MDQTPDITPASPEPSPPLKTPSRVQRIIEHGISFTILIPAIAGFFAFLVTMMLLVPSHGPVDSVSAAFAVSSAYLINAYVMGVVPSLVVGLLAYPLWQQFGGGWQFYLVVVLFNATLCAGTSILFLVPSALSIIIVAAFAAAATLAAVFLTRKLRL